MPARPTPFDAPSLALVTALAVAGCGGGSGLDPDDWPQWRGLDGQGESEAAGIPVSWTPDGENIRWRTAVPGRGNSSPIVVGNRVYLTTDRQNEGGGLSVLALDAASGETVWATELLAGRQGVPDALNTYAAATMASDGESLFAFFGSHLAALDFEGGVRWLHEIDPIFGEYIFHGSGSSPIVRGDRVIVAHDRENTKKPTGWLAAFDKSTGEELWKTEWTDSCCSYSTPIVREGPEGDEIVFFHSNAVKGYDPSTGGVLWEAGVESIQPVPTPVLDGDLLGVVGGAAMKWSVNVFRLSGYGESTELELLWTTKRNVPKSSSPILHDGLLYVGAENGLLTCYRAEDGEVVGRLRLPFGNLRPSAVRVQDRIYFVNETSRTAVLRAGPGLEQLAVNELEVAGRNNASPAVGGGCLLIRTEEELLCLAEAEATG